MLRFGTAGIPISTPRHDILTGIERVARLGLDALEIEFVQSVNMKEEKARLVRKVSRACGVRLSVHAPYYINLNSERDEVVRASVERIRKAARIGSICGASPVVIHAGFYGKDGEGAYASIERCLLEVKEGLEGEGIRVKLGLETTGRRAQFGTLDELLSLSSIRGVVPVIDFSHLHARGGGVFKKREHLQEVVDRIRKKNRRLLDNLHMHLSGIAYSERGERHHLALRESDFPWKDFIDVLYTSGVSGTIISESPNIEGDALLLKKYFTKGSRCGRNKNGEGEKSHDA